MTLDPRQLLPPGFGQPPFQHCRELARGSGGEVWLIGTPRGQFVVKRRERLDPAIDLNRLRALQDYAADAGLAPRLLWLDVGANLEVAEFCEGQGVAAELFASAPFLQRVCRTLGALHAMPSPDPACQHAHWRLDVGAQVRMRAQRLRARRGAGPLAALTAELARLPGWLARVDSRARRPALLHLDIHAGNVLQSDDRLTLLDWDYALIGDPVWDFASLFAPLGLSDAAAFAVLQESLPRCGIQAAEFAAALAAFRLLNVLWTAENSSRV